MRGIYIDSTDPMQNLAIEDYLFNNLSANDQGYFLLWHNAPSIIVGRHQNTLQEINLDLVKRYKLPVVRRMTGGGAVFHDIGNVNFSFIRPLREQEESKIDFAKFLRPILETLHELGVKAEFSSRNDLVYGERKFSGSAQLRRADKGCRRVLHHGTLLVNLDLEMLAAALTGAPDKYLSKGISSIRSRVLNLAEVLPKNIGMKELKAALMQNCAKEVVELEQKILDEANKLALAKYSTEEWNFGASPPFTEKRRERFAWGLVDCYINVQRGYVTELKVFGDFFAKSPIKEFEQQFQNVPYTRQGLHSAIKHIDFEDYFAGCDSKIMHDFFVKL